MTDDVFRQLQKQLDQYSLGFPATQSGIEIQILKKLFTPRDAEIFLTLSPKLETAEQIAPRIGMAAKEAETVLSDMAKRGLVFSLKKEGGVRYGAIAFVHGLFEFQVNRLDPELATLVRTYMDNEFKQSLQDSASDFLRVIPVQKSIDVRQEIATHEDAKALLRKADPIAVAECICRKSSGLIGNGCDNPLEVCFMFGSMAKYYLDHDMGRQVSVEEAEKILAMAQESGLVTQPATSQNPSGMCNCCGDCCGPLSSLKSHPRPADMVFSNYYAVLDPSLCTGCETCTDRCQMAALTMDDDGLAALDPGRCIGCGLCVTTCPTEAIELVQKESGTYRNPPQTTLDQMVNMAANRGLI